MQEATVDVFRVAPEKAKPRRDSLNAPLSIKRRLSSAENGPGRKFKGRLPARGISTGRAAKLREIFSNPTAAGRTLGDAGSGGGGVSGRGRSQLHRPASSVFRHAGRFSAFKSDSLPRECYRLLSLFSSLCFISLFFLFFSFPKQITVAMRPPLPFSPFLSRSLSLSLSLSCSSFSFLSVDR